MKVTRRDALILSIGSVAALGITGLSPARAQALNGPVRQPLHEFLASENNRKGLRRGVREMKKRKPSDPLSWFFQAAIHGVTAKMMVEIGEELDNVNTVRHWNQCPHHGQNSANFLPWHRAYTYHFEKILRMHVEDDDFALPYWDYAHPDRAKFPKEFGIEHLDGNMDNNAPENINPLFHAARNFYLCGYEHRLTKDLPLSELTGSAVDSSRALASDVFFGADESSGLGGGLYDSQIGSRGLLEQSPHDQIHRVVGGTVIAADGTSAAGGMAVPMTAGFDPIFPVHHSNIDRLWAKWSCSPNKSWGTLPPQAWFEEKPWYFFDTDGSEVNLPRRAYFDHRALGVRFADEDMNATPLPLPATVPNEILVVAGGPIPSLKTSRTMLTGSDLHITGDKTTIVELQQQPPAIASDREILSTAAEQTATITLKGIHLHTASTTRYDIYLTRKGMAEVAYDRRSDLFLGTVSLFADIGVHQHGLDQSFSATRAIRALGAASPDDISVVFVPEALATPPAIDLLGLPRQEAGALMIDTLTINTRSSTGIDK